MSSTALSTPKPPSSLYSNKTQNWTERLLIGYCHDAYSDNIEKSIENGINVLIWSFIHMDLEYDPTTKATRPVIQTNLQMDQIQMIKKRFQDRKIIHMAAFGGWNGPHPPITNNDEHITGKDWCHAFIEFNKKYDNIFDGIDWDLEGHDNHVTAPTRKFDIRVLDIMADFSREAKETYGLYVSLAPAESYLDPLFVPTEVDNDISIDIEINDDSSIYHEYETSTFSLNLNLFPSVWKQNVNDEEYIKNVGFSHAGKQCYVYVLYKAGIGTFDWISFQYYESYSRLLFETSRRIPSLSQKDALLKRVDVLEKGFDIILPKIGKVNVKVPYEKIVFGFANGWADGIKVFRVDTNAVYEVFQHVEKERKGRHLGGAMFWTIEEEGTNGVFLTPSLKQSIQIKRDPIESTEL